MEEFARMEKDYKKKFEKMFENMKKSDKLMDDMEIVMNEMAQEITSLKKEQEFDREQLVKMTDKCLDLEVRLRRQNLRIVVQEGREHGTQTRDFVTNLLKEAFKLLENPRIDVAHRVGCFPKRTKCSPKTDDSEISRHLHTGKYIEDDSSWCEFYIFRGQY